MAKKYLKIIALVGVIIALFAINSFAADDITVAIDCTPVNFDQKPLIDNGRTLVPLRAIFEAMGAEVTWDEETQGITAKRDGVKIELAVNSTQAYVNEELKILDVPAKIVNSRTLVPARFIAESMECKVDWNENTQTVIISDKPALLTEENNLYNSYGNHYKKYMSANGKIYDNDNYFCTSPIEVPENGTVYFTYNRQPVQAAYLTIFDENMNPINETEWIKGVYEYSGEAKYLCATIPLKYAERLVVTTDTAADFFLPNEICVAKGKTIEIYNNSIMSKVADNCKYNWICGTGTFDEKGFKVIGTSENVGKHPLKLEIINDSGKVIFEGETTLNITDKTIVNISMLPIGDSLTNGKSWLTKVKDYTDNKLSFVGTRWTGTKKDGGNWRHEGRSGVSSDWYLKDSDYTFENNGETAENPFYDKNNGCFSFEYYKNTYSINPDAIQIFLGTNGLTTDPVKNAGNIKKLVDEIRKEDKDIPIFVVNTMYRGPVYKAGAIDEEKTENEHLMIFNLTEYLTKLLEKDENVYIIPLAFTHDSNNNYSEQDSVHPQETGYSQIADIVYSTYCAHIGE